MIGSVLGEVAAQFAILSLLSIGGANAVIPEIQRRAVEVEHWMTNADFTQLFALSQAAPGPNVLIVSLIGWKVAGVLGGVVALLAIARQGFRPGQVIAAASEAAAGASDVPLLRGRAMVGGRPTAFVCHGFACRLPVAHAWERFRDAPWRIAIQRGLAPVTVGLILASGYVLTRAADHNWVAYAITGATLLLASTTRLHPLSLLAIAAALGAFGLV